MKYDSEQILGQWATAFHECGDYHEAVSIVFDGHGVDDDGNEDPTWHSYAIFVHKDSGKLGFEFPEHDTFGNVIMHRPDEACYYVWLKDVDGEITVENVSDGTESQANIEKFNKVIIKIEKRYQEG